MEITNEELECLVALFKSTHLLLQDDVGNESKTNYGLRWWLSTASKFGDWILPSNKKTNASIVTSKNRLKDEVSINSYSILYFDNLYTNTLLQMYPDKSSWQHESFFILVKSVSDGSMKKYLHSKDELDIWKDIKLFTNMIYGIILRKLMRVINDEFTVERFVTTQTALVTLWLKKLGVYDEVVVIDRDVVLLGSEYVLRENFKYNGLNECNFPIGDITTNHKELNKICRKFKIDIVI